MLRCLAGLLLLFVPSISAFCSVDLGIADDETYKRPNAWSNLDGGRHSNERLLLGDGSGPASRAGVSIAWRNANQVEEVEVRVRNLGDEPGEGRVYVDVLDQTGKVLLHLEPPNDQKIIRVPAIERGGREGKVLRMKASWELNALIDRFDIARTRYHVRAVVDTVGTDDANQLDNQKVKSWNIPFRVTPGQVNVYNYAFTNHESRTMRLRWLFEHTPYPDGWRIDGVPDSPDMITLEPGATISGTLYMKAPHEIAEGAFLEARLSLVNADESMIFAQNEWFQIYDTKPPNVTDYRAVLLQDGTIAVQALVADPDSGILEATGVSTEYSVDGGKTWARKAHNYKVGNFIRPTLFETVIGPFRSGTNVQLRFTALDTAGNAATVIPVDAVAFAAPPNAHKLLEQAYLFPRTQRNPIFEIDQLKSIKKNLALLRKKNVDISSIDFSKPNATGIDPKRLDDLKIGPERFHEVVSDLRRIERIDLDFSKVAPVPIRRIESPIEAFMPVSTIQLTAR